MLVSRDGDQTSTRRAWHGVSAGRSYRIRCEWSLGSQRMEWSVEVECRKGGRTYWRKIDGRWVIAAVREWENAQRLNEALQQ